MSASGQGDQSDTNKDDVSEIISSNLTDDVELRSNEVASNDSEATPIDENALKTHVADKDVPGIEDPSPVKPVDTVEKGLEVDKENENLDTFSSHTEETVHNPDPKNLEPEKLPDKNYSGEPKESSIENDKSDENNSSLLSEDIELRWDDDDEKQSVPLTDDFLKLLDKELGIDEEPESVKPQNEMVQSVEMKIDHKDSLENQGVIDQIDSILQDSDLNKPEETEHVKVLDEGIQDNEKLDIIAPEKLIKLDQDIGQSDDNIIEKNINIKKSDKILTEDHEKHLDGSLVITPEAITEKKVQDNFQIKSANVELDKETDDIVNTVVETNVEMNLESSKPNEVEMDVDVNLENVQKVLPTEDSVLISQQISTKADDSYVDKVENVTEIMPGQLNANQKSAEVLTLVDESKTSESSKLATADFQLIDSGHSIDDLKKKNENALGTSGNIIQSDDGNASLADDGMLDTTINPNTHHRINKPNVMLDIPTQELSDIEAELEDDSISEYNDDIPNDKNIDHIMETEKGCDISEEPTLVTIKSKTENLTNTVETLNGSENNAAIEVDKPISHIRMVPLSRLINPVETDVKAVLPVSKDYAMSKTLPDDERSIKVPQNQSISEQITSDIIKDTENPMLLDKPTKLSDANVKLGVIQEQTATPDALTTSEANKAIETTLKQMDETSESSTKTTSEVNNKLTTDPNAVITSDAEPTATPVALTTSEANKEIETTSKNTDEASKSSEIDASSISSTGTTPEFIQEQTSKPDAVTTSEANRAIETTSKQTDETLKSSTNTTSKSSTDTTSEAIQEQTKVKTEIDDQLSPSKVKVDVKVTVRPVKEETTSTSEVKDEIDAKPSTSKLLDLSSDNAGEIQEVADSLGLLAESFRMMEDDEDNDDDEAEDADDNDDDEDFDPYEESSSHMATDQDDSNTPPPGMYADKPGPSPEGILDIVDDIECVENELPVVDLPVDDVLETPTDEKTGKDDREIIDADEHTKKETDETSPSDKVITILEKILGQKTDPKSTDSKAPSGSKKTKVLNYVDFMGSSSDSDEATVVSSSDVTSVNIPKGVEVMSTSTSGPHSSEIHSKEGELVISGVPKPPAQKVSKLNTSEVSIKTVPSTSTKHNSETIKVLGKDKKSEIFNLDSDEDDAGSDEERKDDGSTTDEEPLTDRKCINPQCYGLSSVMYRADRATAAYYSLSRRRASVCENCRRIVSERTQALISDVKNYRPLIELELSCPSQQLVEISDSESDEEAPDDDDVVGEKGAEYLEEHLADMLNDTWHKYNLESRLKDAEEYIMTELDKIEADAKEIDAMFNECQKKTDAVRFDFYKDYEPRRRHLNAIVIHDTPLSSYSHTEKDVEVISQKLENAQSRYPKRRSSSLASDPPAKKAAIPLGYTPLDGDKMESQDPSYDQSRVDDDKDISVVQLSAESAPADLPPCGEVSRPPLKPGMVAYAMRNAFGTWLKGKILDVQPKPTGQPFTQCRVKFEHKVKNPCKVLAARCLAYPEPSEVRLTIGTRIIALFKDPQNPTRKDSFYGGVVAEIPNPVNNYRYLVFFDDGYAQYVTHQCTRVVCESSNLVWEEVHPFIRDFICNYLLSYPERPMVRLHAGEKLKTEWNGKWWDSKVLKVDASIALIHFDEDNRTEWIYRGSTRLAPLYLELQAAEKAGGRQRSRLPRSKAQMRSNMPCVEYTRSDEQAAAAAKAQAQSLAQQQEELRRQKAVAKKSTTPVPTPAAAQDSSFESYISRVVYYTPKNAIKPYKMVGHVCSVKCKRTDVLSLKELKTYNPLAKPLLSGWERQTMKFKGHKEVMYRAPCGRRLRNMAELHKYLRTLQSDMSVDLFDFTPGVHCLAEYVLNKCIVGKKDLSHGKENVPVPCVNYYDESLPEFCSYNTERTPTTGVPLNLDPEFLCGCDCTDDCVDKTKCACWKMTLEGARTIGLEGPNVGYVYRRLPEPLPSGIYECNSRCKCKNTCMNRVAQHPLNMKLQVFKTLNRGWGIRALNDVPKGSFLCVYAGNLLTDATANLDGLNEGDEYLAELDYIEVVEGMKEGYEEDIPDADKKLDKKSSSRASESDSSDMTESEEEKDPTEKDDDFQPGYLPMTNVHFKKSLRKREKAKKKEQEKERQEAKKKDDCITISDDEEVREPSRFTAQAGMVDKEFLSKSSRRSVRSLYGEDEACYIMDAKVQGNIGRYLNHGCQPNVFVQNVFVDTHDPRFPWVAFFALSHVRAGSELTWNYNYDVGSVPGKVLYCYCGAPNCRGRLL